jgi:hypothetical protein
MKRLILVALVVLFALSVTAFAALPTSSSTAVAGGTTLARLTTFDLGESIAPPPECPNPSYPGC